MKLRTRLVLVMAAGVLLLGGPALAHHSWNAYDLSRSVTLEGAVNRFDWTNPHISLEVNVRAADGSVRTWQAGGPSPSRMSRGGWDRHTVKPGDPITITGNPAKDGSPKMRLNKVTLGNGQQLIVYGDR